MNNTLPSLLANSGFDYAVISNADAQAAYLAATRIKYRLQRTALDIIEIGRDLIEVKRIVGHGHFLKWIDAEFRMSRQSADRFMQAAEAFPEGKSLTVSTLPATVLYALAAPSTSDEVRTEIIERAERGEKIVASDVKELKAKLADRDQKLRTIKSQKQATDGHNSRLIDEIRSKTNECHRLGETIENLREEIRSLNEPGTITVTSEPIAEREASPFGASRMLSLYAALSPEDQARFHKERPDAVRFFPAPSTSQEDAQVSQQAAEKLVGLLTQHFGRSAISELNRLWSVAGGEAVERALGA